MVFVVYKRHIWKSDAVCGFHSNLFTFGVRRRKRDNSKVLFCILTYFLFYNSRNIMQTRDKTCLAYKISERRYLFLPRFYFRTGACIHIGFDCLLLSVWDFGIWIFLSLLQVSHCTCQIIRDCSLYHLRNPCWSSMSAHCRTPLLAQIIILLHLSLDKLSSMLLLFIFVITSFLIILLCPTLNFNNLGNWIRLMPASFCLRNVQDFHTLRLRNSIFS